MVSFQSPRWIRIGAALALALLGPRVGAEPAAAPAANAPAPAMEIKETTQDGGVVEQGTIVKYKFVVSNHGPVDLEVTDVKPSCGCTVPHWDKVIPAGKEGVIEAEVNTTRFRGAITKHLTVTTNDPAHRQFELTLNARVTPLVKIDPGEVALVTVDDKPVSQVFTLERAGGLPMKVLQVTPAGSSLKTELTPLDGPGRYKLTVTVPPDAPWGRTPMSVVVQTDVPNIATTTLTLIVDRGIVTTPPMVFLQAPPGNLPSPQEVTVTLLRQKGMFHVKAAAVDDPKLQAKVQTVRDGQEYRVTVSYAGGWDAGHVQKELTVTTDDPKQPEVKIPVHAMLQQVGAVH
jgi:uncharacterized protein DUF1573